VLFVAFPDVVEEGEEVAQEWFGGVEEEIHVDRAAGFEIVEGLADAAAEGAGTVFARAGLGGVDSGELESGFAEGGFEFEDAGFRGASGWGEAAAEEGGTGDADGRTEDKEEDWAHGRDHLTKISVVHHRAGRHHSGFHDRRAPCHRDPQSAS